MAMEKKQQEKKKQGRRKPKKYLTMHTKLMIIEKVESGTRYEDIEEEFDIQKPFLSKIMAQKNQLRATAKHFTDSGMASKIHCTKAMKFGKFPLLDKALHCWILQQREEGIPVVGDVIASQAKVFHKALYPDSRDEFKASMGFLNRFKSRCQLKTKKINGEMMAADEQAAMEYAHNYEKLVEGYSDDQVFNADETGLVYKLLPSRTVARSKDQPSGWKKARERITVLFCANKTGTIRLPLLVVGKSNNPHCFRGINKNTLPVVYTHQKSAWMTGGIFKEWYWNHFIPYVMKKLRRMNIDCKIILFLDNCSAHPHQDELNNISGTVRTEYLPPHTTSLIQPMDQGIIETAKRIYRHRIVATLISKAGLPFKERLSTINVLYAVREIAHAWSNVKSDTLAKGWYNLTAPSQVITQDEDIVSGHQEANEVIVNNLKQIDIDVAPDDIDDWMNGDGPSHGFLTDDEIVADVKKGINVINAFQNSTETNSGDNSDDDRKSPPTETATSISTVLAWMNGAYSWFSADADTSTEQVKQMAHLRDYVLTRYNEENGEQSIDLFFPAKSPDS